MPGVDEEPTTHYRGCWREHHGCAVAKIEELQQLLDRYGKTTIATNKRELKFYAELGEVLAEDDKEATGWAALRSNIEGW